MKVIDHLKKAKSTLFSFEILPPLKGRSIQEIYETLDPLMEFQPPFIDVTYHRDDFVYKQRDNGFLEKIAVRKRPGTVGICAAIMNRYHVDAVPHVICGGFDKEETENVLIDLNFLEIDNVLILRGDARKADGEFIPKVGGHRYAIELLEQVTHMNHGIYLDNDIQNPFKTNFCIGVAGYPEKHFESPNHDFDLQYLKRKIDMGANYIVTQMFFDNQKYYDFVNRCRNAGITVPIIPGLKPITTLNQVHVLPKLFHVDIPNNFASEIMACKTNDAVLEVAIEWCSTQSRELIKFGAPCLHYYTLGSSNSIQRIIKNVF